MNTNSVFVTKRGALYRIRVPEIQLLHTRKSLENWGDSRIAWRERRNGESPDWPDHKRLFTSGRYHFAHPHGGTPPFFRCGDQPYGFAECHAALVLKPKGYTCWTGAYLFGRRSTRPQRVANTEAIERWFTRTETPLPRTICAHVSDPVSGHSLKPKDPDVVAFHTSRREWLFWETKRVTEDGRKEKVDPRQTLGLAVLHLLTNAPVAVARLVPNGFGYVATPFEVTFHYDGPVHEDVRRALEAESPD